MGGWQGQQLRVCTAGVWRRPAPPKRKAARAGQAAPAQLVRQHPIPRQQHLNRAHPVLTCTSVVRLRSFARSATSLAALPASSPSSEGSVLSMRSPSKLPVPSVRRSTTCGEESRGEKEAAGWHGQAEALVESRVVWVPTGMQPAPGTASALLDQYPPLPPPAPPQTPNARLHPPSLPPTLPPTHLCAVQLLARVLPQHGGHIHPRLPDLHHLVQAQPPLRLERLRGGGAEHQERSWRVG